MAKRRLLKNSFIVFYDEDDQWPLYTFNSVIEICQFLKQEPNYKNRQYVHTTIWNALAKNKNYGKTRLLHSPMYVHIFDENDDEINLMEQFLKEDK